MYSAFDPEMDRQVAIKVLLGGSSSGVRRARFLREIRALAKLEHPNVMRIYDAGERDGVPWFVMPLISTGTLQDRLDRDGEMLSVSETIELGFQLCAALSAAHALGVLHRDVKPDNVLATAEGAVLTDFGLAWDAEQTRLSKTGLFLGSPGYWAPEQAAGRTTVIGPHTDVYGLGATLYAALVGRPPFESESLITSLAAIESAPPEPLSRIRQDVPRWLDRVILKCLEKSPADRYPDVTAVGAALREQGRSGPKSRRRVETRVWIGLGVGVVAVGLGLVALPAERSPPMPPREESGPPQKTRIAERQPEHVRPRPVVPASSPVQIALECPAYTRTSEVVLRGSVSNEPGLLWLTINGDEPRQLPLAQGKYETTVRLPRPARYTIEVFTRSPERVSAERQVVWDSTPPRVELVGLNVRQGHLVFRSSRVVLRGRCWDEGSGIQVLYFNDQEVGVGATGEFRGELQPANELRVEAVDRAGNPYRKTYPCVWDGSNPVVHLEATESDSAGLTTVKGRVEDTHPPEHVNLHWGDRTEQVSLGADGSFTRALQLTAPQTRIWAECVDRSGLSGQSRVLTLTRPQILALELKPPFSGGAAWFHVDQPTLLLRGSLDQDGCELEVALNETPLALQRTGKRFKAKVELPPAGPNALVRIRARKAGFQPLTVSFRVVLQRKRWWADPSNRQLEYAKATHWSVWWQHPRAPGLRFVLVPPGRFTMGKRRVPWARSGVTPHTVQLTRLFYLSDTEVSRGDYERLIKKPVYRSTPYSTRYLQLSGKKKPSAALQAQLPAMNMSLERAELFFQRLNRGDPDWHYRLPTEAEWEYACRAGTETDYFWGDDPAGSAPYCNGLDLEDVETVRNRRGKIHGVVPGDVPFPRSNGLLGLATVRPRPPAGFRPNPWGFFHMLGNVSEYVYGCDPYNSPEVRKNPRRSKNLHRSCAYRGGGFLMGQKRCHPSYRGTLKVTRQGTYRHQVGFRVVAYPRLPQATLRPVRWRKGDSWYVSGRLNKKRCQVVFLVNQRETRRLTSHDVFFSSLVSAQVGDTLTVRVEDTNGWSGKPVSTTLKH